MISKRLFPGGIHPLEARHGKQVTATLEVEELGYPDKVTIPMQQHIGAPSKCIVKKGDKILKGQLIGTAQGFISANVHSSVSGTVLSVEMFLMPNGSYSEAVVIENDKQNNWVELEKCDNPDLLTKEQFINKVMNCGIVGLGGAAFPTHVKLMVKENIDTLVINSSECEPYLSADHRLMLECSDEVLDGIMLIKNKLNIKNAVIGIEDNKSDVITLFKYKTENIKNLQIKVLPSIYPQGGEKQLIYATTKRKVGMGQLPSSVGVLVINVGTCFAISQAIRWGKPLIDRIVTVSGSVEKPKNLNVLIGTSIKDIIESAGGLSHDVKMLINGGPMMGLPLSSVDVPILKGGSGVVALEITDASVPESNCIHCGRCNYSCPMRLSPSEIDANIRFNTWKENEKLSVMNCIECGVCSWGCPAKRRLTQSCKLSKYLLRDELQKRKQEEDKNAK